MEERINILVNTVKDLLGGGEVNQGVRTLVDLHSAETALVLAGLDIDDCVQIMTRMEPRVAARALAEMEDSKQVEIAERLKTGELSYLLKEMPVDEAVDLLGDIQEESRNRLLRLFGREEAVELKRLLRYPDDTAGGLMTPHYLSVLPDTTVDEVIELMRSDLPDIETIYYVYVREEDNRLIGVISLREMIVSPSFRKVSDVVTKDLITVAPDDDQEKVTEVISKYDLLAVPVVDEDGKILGIVTVDDVMDVIEDEAEEDMMSFAGAANPNEEINKGIASDLLRRLPWFILTVIIEILIAGGILRLYSDILSRFVILVFFIPLLVTMGGNIAIQSTTIIGKQIGSGETFNAGSLKTVGFELLWGILVGIIAGATVWVMTLFTDEPSSVGIVIGVSLALTVVCASIVGSVYPLLLRILGRDPAAAPGPLVGTTMDVISLAIYMGIGMALISI